MTTFVKLTDPGSFHTLTVSGVTVDSAGKWPDYNLTDGINTVVIPKSAADRQLERLKLASAFDLVGSTVKVSRSEKPGANGKHFWNLDIVNAREANPAPSKRIPPPPIGAGSKAGFGGAHVPDMDDEPYSDAAAQGGIPAWHKLNPAERDEQFEEPRQTPRETREAVAGVSERETAYLACWDRVAFRLASICKENDIPLDASAIQATTFSIFGGQR